MSLNAHGEVLLLLQPDSFHCAYKMKLLQQAGSWRIMSLSYSVKCSTRDSLREDELERNEVICQFVAGHLEIAEYES